MRVAAIDIGTNSVLLLVGERQQGAAEVVAERATITRLGQGVDRTGELSREAIDRTLACLTTYAGECKTLGVEETVVVGTSAMRDARGGPDFARAAAGVLGVEPRVISGEEEAGLAFRGALSGLPIDGATAVFDVGGGSTEWVLGSRASPTPPRAVSVNAGSVRLTERYLASDPPTLAEQDALRHFVDGLLASLERPDPSTTLVGVAGTVTTIAAVARGVHPYDGARVHGLRLSADEVSEVTTRLLSVSLSERRSLPGMDPRRADVIVGGALLVERIVRWTGLPELVVSDRGVRWGLLLKALGL